MPAPRSASANWHAQELWAPPDQSVARALQEIARNSVIPAPRPRGAFLASLVVGTRPIAVHWAISPVSMPEALGWLVDTLGIMPRDRILLSAPYGEVLAPRIRSRKAWAVPIASATIGWMMDAGHVQAHLARTRGTSAFPKAILTAPDPQIARLCERYGVWLIEDRRSVAPGDYPSPPRSFHAIDLG